MKKKQLYIVDQRFTISGTKKDDSLVIVNKSQFDEMLKKKSHFQEIIILVNLMWSENDLFTGYEVARILLSNDNIQRPFNLLFLTSLPRKTLFQKVNSLNKPFPKCYPHEVIDGNVINQVEVPNLSDSKFEYLRKYAITESGMVDKLAHDIDPNKVLTESQKRAFLDSIFSFDDIVGERVMSIVNGLDYNKLHLYQSDLYTALLDRRYELNGVSEARATEAELERVRSLPTLVLVEDDPEQNEKLEQVLSRTFLVESFRNGLDALDCIAHNSSAISVLLTDMELLNQDNLDEEIQGIDLIEQVQEKYPHIVILVASYLPRNGLRLLLGQILPVRNIVLKHLLFESDDSYIADLVSDVRKEIDLKKQFQRLRGPENSLWGSRSRQTGQQPGRLKQFYYELKQNWPNEFIQMWADIDATVKKVLDGDDPTVIDSRFPSTGKTKEIANMPIQKAIGYLKEILINRLFWLKKVKETNDVPKARINFDDYRIFFRMDFKLFSSDPKRHSQYGGLTGFRIEKGINPHEHIIHFGQLLTEEKYRYTPSRESLENEFDLQNSLLLDIVYDVLEIIVSASQRAFQKEKYPRPDEWWEESNDKNRMEMAQNIFDTLGGEQERIRQVMSRRKVLDNLEEFQESEEYDLIPENLRRKINNAKKRMELLLEG